MIFKSEATKTFINVDEIVLFQYQNTYEKLGVRHPDKSKVFESSAWIVLKNCNSFAVTLTPDEMDQLWKMISDNKSHSKEFDDWLKKRWKGVEGANEKAFVNTIKKETEAMEKEFANEINDSEIKNALAWDLKN